MRADKFTTTIVIETLSPDCVAPLISDAIRQITDQKRNGQLVSEDGDTVIWKTESIKVEF